MIKLLTAILCLGSVPVRSAVDASFGSGDNFAKDLWTYYSELSNEFGASSPKSLKPGARLGEVVRKNGDDLLLAARLEGGMVKKFNRMQLLHSVTSHPARLEFARKSGSLVGTLGRTWINPAPYDANEVEFVFKKLDGKGKAEVTFNIFRPNGNSQHLWNFVVDPGDENSGKIFRRTFQGVKNGILAATVDGKSVANRIEYEVHIRRPGQGNILQPVKDTIGPVRGFADLHAHHMAEHAFAGQFVFGSPFGTQRSCTGNNHAQMPGAHPPWRGKHLDRTRPGIDWPLHLDAQHQMMHASQLKQAVDGGLRLMVASVVNNMWLAHLVEPFKRSPVPIDDMDNIKLQIKAIHDFAKRNPWYRVARDPWEARKIIQDGNLAVIIAVEVSHLLPESHGNWEDQLDELYGMGVRCMEIAHETDSRFAGAAHHHGLLLSVMDSLKSMGQGDLREAINEFRISFPDAIPLGGFLGTPSGQIVLPKLKIEASPFNTVGLLPAGRKLLQEMAKRKMLFEIDHCSRKARSEIHQFFTDPSSAAEVRNYPYFYSHARFDELMPPRAWIEQNIGKAPYAHAEGFDSKEDTGEYMPTQQEVSRMQTLGGVFGVRTGPNAQLPFQGSPVANRVHTSGRSVAQIVSMGKSMGLAMALGTDMMGFVPQSGARFKGTQKHAIVASGLPRQEPDKPGTDKPVGGSTVNEYDVFGLKHVGLEPDLLKDLENLGLPVPEIKNSAESVLRMWERCYQTNRTPLTRAQYKAFMGLPN